MFAVADQRRFTPWLVASAFVHALGAACLIAGRALPGAPPEPLRIVRVDLVGPSLAPGPPAAAPSAEALPPPAPPPEQALPAPRPRPEAKPAPRRPSAPPHAAGVVHAPAPAAPAEAAPELASPAAGGAGAAGGAALAAVATGPPSGAGGGAGDALAAYIARLQRAIDAHKSYPPMARRRGIEGVVTLRLAIDAEGGLSGAALVGRAPAMLARSTREAVDRASPFPPPPAGPLQIEFPVRYEIVD